eukprot:9048319-Alexandrium_andersonii.AAC.1
MHASTRLSSGCSGYLDHGVATIMLLWHYGHRHDGVPAKSASLATIRAHGLSRPREAVGWRRL